ncbi:MAG: hypothetical protein HY608_07855 [Planctomycetes bacterium]|nr:hypothetical protein [Planctomycetota bacterium]
MASPIRGMLGAGVLLACSALPTREAVSEDPPGPARDVMCEMILVDGTRLLGRVTLEEIQLRTVYGLLRVPGTDVEELLVGVHVSPEDAARALEFVRQMASDDFRTREEAAAALERLGRGAIGALEGALGSADPEVVARAQQILGRLRESLGEVRREEEVYTRNGRFRGEAALGPIRIRMDVGELTIPPSKIEKIMFDRSGGRFVEGFEDGLTRWTETHNTRTQWHVCADAADGRQSLRCGIPNEANYDDGVQARLEGPRVMVGTHRRSVIRFQYKLFIEQGADHCWVKLIAEGGAEILSQELSPAAAWTQMELPIPAGTREVRPVFEFRTDGSVQAAGPYIDQIEILDKAAGQ